MPTFSGAITTTGKSEAIRMDKALFRLHPEFRQKAKVRAQVISPGHALITVVVDDAPPVEADDPVVTAFLGLLEKDMKSHPGRGTRLSKESLGRSLRLTRNARVKDDEAMPEEVTF